MSYLDFDFPHTRFFESDLRELIKQVFIMNDLVTNFVSINAIKYANPIQWDITKSYEKNTVVIDGNSGVAYISVRPVPPGIGLTREQYWTKVFDLSVFITKGSANFAVNYEEQPTTTATLSTPKDNWVVWDTTLYQALTNITPGDRYVPGGNIRRMTVEDFFNILKSIIDNEIHERETGDDALEIALNEETELRSESDAALHREIVQESVDRENADNTLQDNIDAEVQTREIADITLQGNIDAEAQERENADNELRNLITGDAGEINTKLDNFIVSRNEIVINVKDYGAVGDGSHDDYSAIMSAINALPAGGGTVYFPAGNYAISQGIEIGDGTAAVTANGHPSTKQNIKLKGAGCNRAYTPQVTQITPLGSMSYVMNVRGLINNVEIDGFNLYANGKADYGLFICGTNFSTFKNIEIYNPSYCGLALVGGKAPTGNYNTACKFKQITVSLNTNTTVGLRLTGDISANNDTWLTTFEDCRFQSLGGTNNCTSGEFRFCDNITFIRCHFVTYSQTGRGIDLNALDSAPNNPFPTGLSFIDCSIANTNITEDAPSNRRIGDNRFYGYGITDGEVLPPNDSRLIGFDASGKPFNGFGQHTFNSISDIVRCINHMPINTTHPMACGASVSNGIWGVGGVMGGVITRRTAETAGMLAFTSAGLYYATISNNGSVSDQKHVTFTT